MIFRKIPELYFRLRSNNKDRPHRTRKVSQLFKLKTKGFWCHLFFFLFFLSDLEKMQISFKLYVMYYIKQFTILICKILHNFKHNNTQCVPLYNQIPSSLRGKKSYCGLLTSHLRNIRLKKYFDNMLKKHKKYSIYQVFKSK